jgi:hypothetical protein
MGSSSTVRQCLVPEAPTARNVIARGKRSDALDHEAPKVRNRLQYSAPSALRYFLLRHLGRWPRLLYFAPLALLVDNFGVRRPVGALAFCDLSQPSVS